MAYKPTTDDIWTAANRGNLDDVKHYLAHGTTTLDQRQRYGCNYTPLMHAARWGHRTVVEYLVGLGADPNLTDEHGWTAAAIARMDDQHELAGLLSSMEKMTKEERMAKWGEPQQATTGSGEKMTKEQRQMDKWGGQGTTTAPLPSHAAASTDAEEDVELSGSRSWAERDAELRQHAVPLDDDDDEAAEPPPKRVKPEPPAEQATAPAAAAASQLQTSSSLSTAVPPTAASPAPPASVSSTTTTPAMASAAPAAPPGSSGSAGVVVSPSKGSLKEKADELACALGLTPSASLPEVAKAACEATEVAPEAKSLKAQIEASHAVIFGVA